MKSVVAENPCQPIADDAMGTALPSEVLLQRSVGAGRVSFKPRDGGSVLEDVFQSGCCKIRFPRSEPGACPQAVLINTAGGLTDADVMNIDARWRPGTCATVTSQAAERIYRSRGKPALVKNHLAVARGATALWLPQETILFDGGRLSRRLDADVESGGRLLACESVVFGRHAMGETVRQGMLHDAWRIRYDGKLVFAEALRIDAQFDKALARPAVMGGAGAMATVFYVDADAAALAGPVRDVLAGFDAHAGCSVIGPVMVVRILGATGAEMRGDLMTVVDVMTRLVDDVRGVAAVAMVWAGELETVAGLPRVWNC